MGHSHGDPSPIGVPAPLRLFPPTLASSLPLLMSLSPLPENTPSSECHPALQCPLPSPPQVAGAHQDCGLAPHHRAPPLPCLSHFLAAAPLSSHPQPIVGIVSWQTLFPFQHSGPSLCAPGSPSSLQELHRCLESALASAAVSVPPFQLFLPVLQYRRAVEFVLLRSLTLPS